ncbi:hypothetical protein [Acidisphaera sp. L21]|uniref:hypothetical protein n=1 Tax=Acidisphaera sp. L21 TaxID=1641851 RepID=UPI00131C668D|nr:hypothetical protein [Acidisphaera sp. L21]
MTKTHVLLACVTAVVWIGAFTAYFWQDIRRLLQHNIRDLWVGRNDKWFRDEP